MKKHFLIILVSGVLTACSNGSMDEAAERSADLQAISHTISTSIGWALTKDTTASFACFVQDTTFFIFHPDSASTIRGWDQFKELSGIWLDPRFEATDYKIKELRINLSADGQVAWFSCFLDDHALWDGKRIGWDNARWTGVLEKRDGRWLIAQMHFSFPQ